MAAADESSVVGDFDGSVFEEGGARSRFFRRNGRYFVHTEGPEGERRDFEVAYTFGFEPLQQYLVPFSRGRLQCLPIAWDVERARWIHLYPGAVIPPGDWLHWTRPGQNWNGMCAECHSTHLQKRYDAETRSFETTWSEIDVSCEACHGPGSRHVSWAQSASRLRSETNDYGLVLPLGDLDARREVERCSPCHSRRTLLGEYDPAQPDLLDNFVPALLREGLYYADGQILDEVYVYGSFAQSEMYRQGVRCSDCHDVHSLELLEAGNGLCLRCHEGEAYDSIDHHFHQKTGRGTLCTQCHMPERRYMIVDPRGDHSFRVPRPDLTLAIGTPNACSQTGCHEDRPVDWLVDAYETWYGLAREPHYGTVLAAGREGRPDAVPALVRLAADRSSPSIVRATALSILGAFPEAQTAAVFERAFLDGESLVRYAAVEHWSPPSPEQAAKLLAPLLSDRVRAVRILAAARLAGPAEKLLGKQQKDAFEKSLLEYRDAMEYSLDFPFAGLNLGNLYVRRGEPGRAESYLERALEIDEHFYPAKLSLAELYATTGRIREAEGLFREVLAWADRRISENSDDGLAHQLKSQVERTLAAMPP